jgi:hypothetical protein
MVKGINSEKVRQILWKIPESKGNIVAEVTLDMAATMEIIKSSFPEAALVFRPVSC